MDVSLDSNIYLSDLRMEGIAFRSLLDYLRKTQSRIILPKVVLDEVIAKYPDRVRNEIGKAQNAVKSLRACLLAKRLTKIPEIDVKRESRALKSKLLKPSEHVKSVVLRNFGKVRVEEVVRRGIERVPPASDAGEELRDVITWLMVLDHAETSKREVAFVTADKHFRTGNELRQQLAKEVHDRALRLHFYTSIDEFIKAHAPTPQGLNDAQAFALIGKQHVLDRFEIAARSSYGRFWRNATAIEVVARDVKFSKGALYGVGPESQYGELEFNGELKLRVTTPKEPTYGHFTTFLNTGPTPTLASQVNILPSSRIGTFVAIGEEAHGVSEWLGEWDGVFPTMISGQPMSFPVPLNPPHHGGVNVVETNTAHFIVFGKLTISVRLVSGKVKNLETENFELADATQIASQG